MSSLWTPGGERPVGRDRTGSERAGAEGAPSPEDLTDEQRQQLEDELAEMQRRLLDTPAAVVVANHAIGLFQLASLHLSQRPPSLEEGRLAIDGMTALVEGLAGRLGDQEQALREALSQLRLAYVEVARRAGQEPGDDPGGGERS